MLSDLTPTAGYAADGGRATARAQGLKRMLDLLVAIVLLVLTAPTMAVLALAVRLCSSGPVLFAHPRIGRHGRPFACYKFRTMVPNAAEVLTQLLLSDPAARAEWERDRKLRSDPRITPIGRLLRRTSLDELPQLFNVLRGEMSLVGPRPVPRDELQRYGDNEIYYLQVRPGVTGLWQVSGRNSLSYESRVWLDVHYVRNWTLATDLWILWATLPAVLSGSWSAGAAGGQRLARTSRAAGAVLLRAETGQRPHRRRPLRLLYVVEATSGGTGRHVLDLMDGMLDRGHEVHLAYWHERIEPRFAEAVARNGRLRSVLIRMKRAPGLGDLRAILALQRYLRRHGPFDVVHGHSSKGGLLARLAATGSGAARVYTAHAIKTLDAGLGRSARRLYATAEYMLARMVTDAFVAVSPEEYAHVLTLGFPRALCHLIPNGVRLPPDLPDRRAARAMFDLPPDAPVVLFVGRLCQQKDPLRFIAIVAALRAEVPGLRALMLGGGETMMLDEVRAAIARHRLAGCLDLYTQRRGVDGMMAADVLLTTSRYEGMSYALLEAGALGLPIVTTEVGGTRLLEQAGVDLVIAAADGLAAATARKLRQGGRAGMAAAPPGHAPLLSQASDQVERLYASLLKLPAAPAAGARGPEAMKGLALD